MDQRAAIVCAHVAEGGHPILRAVRDEPQSESDSGWQFTCGGEHGDDADEARVWLVSEVVERDRSIAAVQAASGFVRNAPGAPWIAG